jgi:two-component system cell cycle response regulator DivK
MAQILIVDDDCNSRLIVRDILEGLDYDLLEAATGPDGVRQAEAHLPDLILMDRHLPGFDGVEAIRLLKANPLLRRIPIIAVTAHETGSHEAREIASLCDGFLSKPFPPASLLEAIQSFLL